jgi:hypothetical protein
MRLMTGRHLRPHETRTRADALPPAGETMVTADEALTLGGEPEHCGNWSSVQVGQADVRSGQPRRLLHQLRNRGQAYFGLWQCTSYLPLVRCFTVGRPRDTLDVDIPDEGAVGVAVENADDLVHPRAGTGMSGLEPRPRKHLVHISGYRTRFVEAKSGMLIGGDFAERVSRLVLGWWASRPENIDRDKLVRDALFLQSEAGHTHIYAVRRTEEYRFVRLRQ